MFACILGGGMGALLAHYAWYPSLWSFILGFSGGGVASYIAFAPKEAILAVPHAWRKTWEGMEDYGVPAIKNIFLFVWMLLPAIVIPLFVGINTDRGGWLFALLLFGGSVGAFYGLATERLKYVADSFRELLSSLNPLRIYCVMLPLFFFEAIKKSWRQVIMPIILFFVRFPKALFLLIHSEMRLLCLFDGGIGALAGAFTYDALMGVIVGMITGGLVGILNFELVSKRLLHLVPSSNIH